MVMPGDNLTINVALLSPMSVFTFRYPWVVEQ
jgi:hypothetical protein